MSDLTVLIPFYQGHAHLLRLLDSLPADLPVVVVDDGHSEGHDFPDLGERENGRVAVLHLRQKGYFAGAVNAGILACKTDVLVLNQDTWLEGDAWRTLLAEQRDRYAMIGERIVGAHPAFPEGYPHGTFLFLRRDALDAVGLLNAADYPLWGNTAEWYWRATRRGYDVLALASVPGFHHARGKGERYGSGIRTLLDKQPDMRNALIRTPPLLSVIVPCFNYGRYLEDCIHSLIGGPTSMGDHPGQTLQSFEVIVVDDASTDGSDKVCRALADPRRGIRAMLRTVNGGTAKALNTGIALATGEFITFLSADDMREARSLERLVRACQANPGHFAYDDVQMFGNRRLLRTWRLEEFDAQRLLTKNHVHAGIVYPRTAWMQVGGYPEAFGNGREDWAFNVALARSGWCGVHVRQYGYWYRREGHNRSLTNTTPQHREAYLAMLKATFPDVYDGSKEMPCCGGKRTSSVRSVNGGQTSMSAAKTTMNGAEGFILLEYLGSQQVATWPGEVSNTNYRFGVSRRMGYVDKRDAGERPSEGSKGSGFLAVRKDGKQLFRVAPEPVLEKAPAAQPQTAEATMTSEEAHLTPAPVVVVSKAVVAAPVATPDPGVLTTAEIKALVLSPEQWVALIQAEEAGKARQTVLLHARRQAAA